MIDPTLTISIDRSGLEDSPSPLVFSAALDDTTLGILGYQAPAMAARLGYMPDHPDVDGSELTSAAWQKTLLNFDWAADLAASETIAQAAYAEVLTAIAQFQFLVTTQVNGAPAQVWSADRGSMTPSERTYVDLAYLGQAHSVSIPVQPIPGAP